MPTNVLVIESNELFARIYKSLLSSMHCRVLHARTKTDAICLAGAEKPDLICTELRLPDGSGAEAIRLIRQMPELGTVPIIVVSTRAAGRDGDAAKEAGATVVVSKPVSTKDLLLLMQRYLSGEPSAGCQLNSATIESSVS